MVNNSSKWWDITLDGMYDHQKIREFFKVIARRWAFQKERADSGFIHYQCKVELKERCNISDIIKKLIENELGRGHVSRSHQLDNFDYVTKEETRIDGPWKWDDIVIPKWLEKEPEWYPWQKDVIKFAPEERKVRVIIDLRGNTGKSYLSNWLAVRGKACIIPVVGNYKDALRAICDRPANARYILDVPRAEQFNNGMIAALESLKDGHVWDDRYKFTEKWMDPPTVIVFCNQAPRRNLLSADRWETYLIDEALVLNRV